MRLIDADALLNEVFERYCKNCDKRKGMKNGQYKVIYEIGEAPCRACEIDDFTDYLEEAPTVDAVEVIHCEHCRHHENDSSSDSHWCFVWETFTDNHVYCSFAERRKDG